MWTGSSWPIVRSSSCHRRDSRSWQLLMFRPVKKHGMAFDFPMEECLRAHGLTGGRIPTFGLALWGVSLSPLPHFPRDCLKRLQEFGTFVTPLQETWMNSRLWNCPSILQADRHWETASGLKYLIYELLTVSILLFWMAYWPLRSNSRHCFSPK